MYIYHSLSRHMKQEKERHVGWMCGVTDMRAGHQTKRSECFVKKSFLAPTTMSRLIVKNLPAHITPEHLRKHFEQAGRPDGTLTDVKVAHKQDGTSRRFGFVGYKTDLEAASAKAWFDKTFLGSTRIAVDTIEVCFLFFHSPCPSPTFESRF